MAKLHSLSISGYKSIKNMEHLELKNLNILIGANGSGKSNFISLFRLLNAIGNRNLNNYVEKQGGINSFLHFGRKKTDKIHIEFYFDNNSFKFDIVPTNDNNKVSFKLREVKIKLDIGQEQIPLFSEEINLSPETINFSKINSVNIFRMALESKWTIYHFHDTSETANVKDTNRINDNLKLKYDAANLAAYLRKIREQYPAEYQRIVETIRLVLPFFHDFVYREEKNLEYIELEWYQKEDLDTPLKAHMLSDGSLRFICLATLLLQPLELLPDTIIIDEPELGLHPYAISVLADIFKQVAEDKQLIIATQSVELINEFEPEDIIVVEQHNGSSSFKRLSSEELNVWLKDYSLGELWDCNIIGGRP
ncbi:MAG: AAA family ATPase [Neisseriaceae bacterium]|nr:AAA family ATPase [Neisseriaceae bacterium]